MTHSPDKIKIRTRACPHCFLCGECGRVLYEGLTDRLFGAPGTWNLKRCSNPDCGLLWLDPMPLPDDMAHAYANYYTHAPTSTDASPTTAIRRFRHYLSEGYLCHKYQYRAESIGRIQRWLGRVAGLAVIRRASLYFRVMYLPSKHGGLLLEVGCGNGQTLLNLAARDWKVEDVDFDPVAVQNARGKGLSVHLGDLAEQHYPDEHFEAVIMSHVIEHVHDPLKLLQESHRILKNGGRLVVVTPNAESWGHRLYRDAWLGLDPPRHLQVFTCRTLRQVLQAAGFRIVSVRTSIRAADQTFIASRSIRHTGLYTWGATGCTSVRIWAKTMQMTEWALLQFKANLGEEIVVIGEK